ncbi:hypothetical protein ACWCQN_48155, partial [Streptomyces sp. NPDC001984]
MDQSVPNKSSFTRARQQLGSAPLERVFRRVAGAIAPPTLEAAFWRGMRVAAVDGFLLDVPENDTTRAAFGGQVDSAGRPIGFPQARVVRRTRVEAAESRPGTDPDRCGFTIALQTARDLLVCA